MSREFVDSVTVGNNLEAEKAFKDSMSNKVGDALEIKRKEVSKSFVGAYTDQESDVNEDE